MLDNNIHVHSACCGVNLYGLCTCTNPFGEAFLPVNNDNHQQLLCRLLKIAAICKLMTWQQPNIISPFHCCAVFVKCTCCVNTEYCLICECGLSLLFSMEAKSASIRKARNCQHKECTAVTKRWGHSRSYGVSFELVNVYPLYIKDTCMDFRRSCMILMTTSTLKMILLPK